MHSQSLPHACITPHSSQAPRHEGGIPSWETSWSPSPALPTSPRPPAPCQWHSLRDFCSGDPQGGQLPQTPPGLPEPRCHLQCPASMRGCKSASVRSYVRHWPSSSACLIRSQGPLGVPFSEGRPLCAKRELAGDFRGGIELEATKPPAAALPLPTVPSSSQQHSETSHVARLVAVAPGGCLCGRYVQRAGREDHARHTCYRWFWSAYTPCDTQNKDAVKRTLEQMDVIHRMCQRYPETFTCVTNSSGIRQAFRDNKVASLIGVEGGHSIDSSLGVLRALYHLGMRYLTLTHSCNTPWADNWLVDTGENDAESQGLSPFGELVLKEMNRLGVLVDLAHVSKATMLAVLKKSAAPVIFSHSSAYEICQHRRNVPDDVLQLVTTWITSRRWRVLEQWASVGTLMAFPGCPRAWRMCPNTQTWWLSCCGGSGQRRRSGVPWLTTCCESSREWSR
ncbi:dipeptidase 1 isoform X2 [Tenrec ecaudatus]|uniref:dipeptidase 1 isoform X2 n=1 Tax=Tenrec ecaudatus TaxID=94439 RepID=UPI003F5A3CF5